MSLYPSSRKPFDPDIFADPPAEYRGAPFFSWNSVLEKSSLIRRVNEFHRMGMGGAHLHPRTGLATEYLGEEFMDAVQTCLDEGKTLGMRMFLYDEDRWPSGAAGGLVTQEPTFHARYLRFTKIPYGSDVETPFYWPPRNEAGELMAVYRLFLDEQGYLLDFQAIDASEAEVGDWFVYSEAWLGTPWFGGNPYLDTLNPAAVKRFIEVTHEKYAERFEQEFGEGLPSIFTDEPQTSYFMNLAGPNQEEDVTIPFTLDLPDSYHAVYGEDVWDRLPEFFWDFESVPNSFRYRYLDHVTERFVQAFADQVGDWCEAHNLPLTGHMMEESSLLKQTRAVGEAMRSYRGFQLPGIDMLCDWWELLTAKQCQSAVRQFGREGMTSELYGVTNWDYDFPGHKRQGDWQAALGVTLRVHHLAWLSMEGESKRDYPAAIGYQSPWYEEYPIVEDHFARLNSVLTRGKPKCRVAVIHPIESFWMNYGCKSLFGERYESQDKDLNQLIDWLLGGLIDFDFISEALLPGLLRPSESGFQVGEMHYDVVLLPNLQTLRTTTFEILSERKEAVILVGDTPFCLDAEPSSKLGPFIDSCRTIAFEQEALLEAVEPQRIIDVSPRPTTLLYQLREEGDERSLFLCNTSRTSPIPDVSVRIRGDWAVSHLDTLTGERGLLPTGYVDGWTEVSYSFPAHGSLLLQLSPGRFEVGVELTEEWEPVALPEGPFDFTLDEPNVLLLDQARFRVDDGPWQETEETLRIENKVRAHLGLRVNDGQLAQPWTEPGPAPVLANLELEYGVHCEVEVSRPTLALEKPEETQIWLDGVRIEFKQDGYFTDESIKTVILPDLSVGDHSLRLIRPFTKRSNVEWCYLLGAFGVRVEGRDAMITKLPETLVWGDWTRQGLPFYGGNVIYHVPLHLPSGEYRIRCQTFKSPLLRVTVGETTAPIAFAPFEAEVGHLEGSVTLDLKAYGSRINTFGQVHCNEPKRDWFGPDSWRTQGEGYSYEYILKPCGVLQAPCFERKKG